MAKILLVISLLAMALGFILSMGWFDSNADANDLFAILFAGLAAYVGSHLVP